jgi:hypothetical protein
VAYILIGNSDGESVAKVARTVCPAPIRVREEPVQVALTESEAEFLEGLLQKTLGKIREEVYHADVSQFRDELKTEEGVLRSPLARLAVQA